jgi:hypothetical protein
MVDDLHPNTEDRIYGELALKPSATKNFTTGKVYGLCDLCTDFGSFAVAICILACIMHRVLQPVSAIIYATIPDVFWTEGQAAAGTIVPWKSELVDKLSDEQTITLNDKDILDLIHRVDLRKRP